MTAYLSPADVAAELACSRDSVERAIKRGDLEAVRYGRLIRVSRSALDRFLAAHSTANDLTRHRRRSA